MKLRFKKLLKFKRVSNVFFLLRRKKIPKTTTNKGLNTFVLLILHALSFLTLQISLYSCFCALFSNVPVCFLRFLSFSTLLLSRIYLSFVSVLLNFDWLHSQKCLLSMEPFSGDTLLCQFWDFIGMWLFQLHSVMLLPGIHLQRLWLSESSALCICI